MSVLREMSHLSIGVIVAGSVLAAVYLWIILRSARRVDWFKVVCSFIGALRTTGDVDQVLHEKMSETRRLNLHGMVRLMVFGMFPVFVSSTIFQILAKSDEERIVAVRLVGFAATFLLHLGAQGRHPTLRTLRTWQRFCFVLACVHVAPGICPPARLINASRVSGMVITGTNFAQLHAPTSVAQHFLYLLVVGFCFAASSLEGMRADWMRHVFIEAGAALVSCGCVVAAQRFVQALQRSNMEARSLADKLLANNKLLRIFYEVVLEVDSELSIVSSEPDLGLFLPRGSGSSPPRLLGTKLDALLPNERDRELLRGYMHRPPAGGEASVNVMHLEMRCSGSDSLQVEICSHSFQSPTGGWRHILGVREFGDEGRAAAPCADEPCLVLRVGVFDPSLCMKDISPDLQRVLGGPTPGSSLLQVLGDAADFADRFQEAVNSVGNEDDPAESTTFKAVLRPLGQSACVLANCRVTVDEASRRGRGGPMAQLCFSDLVPIIRQRSSSNSDGGSSGGRSARRRRGTPRQLRSSQLLAPRPQAVRLGVALSL